MRSLLRAIQARVFYSWGSLHRNFGNVSSLRSEHRAAVLRFTQAYEKDPGLRQARLDRGIVLYRELGQHEAALEDFNALLEEDPTYGPALLNRAMVGQERGEYATALADLEAYLAISPEGDQYRSIADRTAALLREIIAELPPSG
jgi:tetratricopeptide (TPR) repeat protein